MAGILSGYMLVFAVVQSGHLGFGVHAINLQTPSECQHIGDKIVKQASAENGSVFYTCYNVQNMVPLTARVTASLENGEVRFNSATRLYDTTPECVSAGNKFLEEADENFNGAVAELVGIRVGVVSGVINLESSGVEASDWRLRHDQGYHEA